MSSSLLNESNIEITEIIIPEDETLENVDEFLRTMWRKLKDVNHSDPAKVIRSINAQKIIIKGTRNEAYAIANQLNWKMHRRNPPKSTIKSE